MGWLDVVSVDSEMSIVTEGDRGTVTVCECECECECLLCAVHCVLGWVAVSRWVAHTQET